MKDDPILKCLEYHASAGGEYTYWGEQALIRYKQLKSDAEWAEIYRDRLAEALKEIIAADEIHEKLMNHETPAQRIARSALAERERGWQP